jgi:hypothetical protein
VLTPYRGVRYHLKEWGRATETPLNKEEYWINFNTNITRGFINGLKKIRSDTLLLCDKFMTGLYDCY